MFGEGLLGATKFLVLALGVLYVAAALGGAWLIDFGTTRDLVLWLAFLGCGAVLMFAGQFVVRAGGVVRGPRLRRRRARWNPARVDAHRPARGRGRRDVQHRARAATAACCA